ncbi:hypothetical protein PR202_gb02163 [Eleusine coracana subsp. coracana]|uniref:glucose-6-phosphate 1-epimerase n=1 Tax=Eleusine coracana subsp. coracana TaxID=191504 RepID=A0AAV5DYB9_ELECO|nr:hypothetical protein PR202_gb02163 [Eleusine coracana subsp. coracana]
MSMGHFTNSADQRSGLEVVRDWNGVAQLVLRSPKGHSARVSMHGGQVVSWKNDRGEELLFTSSKAIFKPPYAMRGGIQMCFPQFGNSGTLERHGFARNRIWIIDDEHPPTNHNGNGSKATVNLLLKPSEDDLKCWPHCFEFRLRVSLSKDGDLSLKSRIRNVNGKPFSFSFAYHTYLSVDRVYVSSPNVIAVLDHEKKHSFVIKKDGLPDVVVWNPWEKKSKTMVDFGDEEYKQTLCVDAAAVERAITLKPGEEWTGKLELSAVSSTNCSDHLDHPVSI